MVLPPPPSKIKSHVMLFSKIYMYPWLFKVCTKMKRNTSFIKVVVHIVVVAGFFEPLEPHPLVSKYIALNSSQNVENL